MPTETKDPLEIDINDPILQQEMVEADPDADFYEQAPPPPDDRDYQAKVLLGDKGLKAAIQKRKGDLDEKPTGPKYLKAWLDVRIIDPGQPWDGAPTSYYADSLIWDSKGTSKIHTILRALGHPALGRMGIAELRDHLLSVLASELVCGVKGRWEASVKDGEDYRTVKIGMKNFPLIDEGHPELGRSPWIEDTVHIDQKTRLQVGTGEMVRAYFKVREFFRLQ